MHRRQFLHGLGAAVVSTAVVPSAASSGPDVPAYISINEKQELLNQFEKEEIEEKDGNDWSWTLTRYIHKDKAQECSENLGLDVPPYGLYVYHLNAGRRLGVDPAIEKEGACVSLGGDYKIASVRTDCITKIETLATEPDPTEVGEKAKSLFQDRIEEELPISSGEWEFGLKKPGWIGNDWDYTKSGATVLDKRTYTASVDSETREEIDNQFIGNDLEVRGLLTTEKASRTGHYLATIGVVPDSNSIDTEGWFSDLVEFNPESYRDRIRTLKKAVTA